MAPAWKDESGWTLPELLVGLFLSLSIAASSLVVLQTTMRSQMETGSRLTAQDAGTSAMQRLTRDIRTATVATVQSSTVLDLQLPQYNPAGGGATSVHVRYACTGFPESCTRSVCGTPVNSNSCGTPTDVVDLADGVMNTDNFRGVSVGADQPYPATTPASFSGTGSASASNVGFISVHLRIARTVTRFGDGSLKVMSNQYLDFHDGADLENFSN
jgi:type II secretory pathway pseudopilin PulG